jgi:hypothetical protein
MLWLKMATAITILDKLYAIDKRGNLTIILETIDYTVKPLIQQPRMLYPCV